MAQRILLFASIKFVNVSRNVLKVPSFNTSKAFSSCKVRYCGTGRNVNVYVNDFIISKVSFFVTPSIKISVT